MNKNTYRYIFFLLLLLMPAISRAQKNPEQEVRNVLKAQSEAWNKGHIETFMQGYWQSDSLMFIGKNGVTYGWTKTLNNYKKGYPDTASMGQLEFTLLSVKKLSDQYFVVIGKWHLSRSIGDVQGHFNLLFRKIGNKWVIVMDHTS